MSLKSTLSSVSALLFGTLLLTAGTGLLGTILGVRMEEAGFPVMTSGLVMSVFYIGITVGSLYSHKIIDSVGHIRAFAAFATIFSAATLAHGFIIEAWSWSALRFIAGFSSAGLLLCIESWLNTQSNNETRGTVLSLYMVTYYIGFAIGQGLLNIPDKSGFGIYVISSIILSLSLLPVVTTTVPGPSIHEPKPFSFSKLFKISPLGVFGCAACGLTTAAFYSLTPVFAKAAGLDLKQISFLMAATISGGFATQWPTGFISDHYDRRKVLLAISIATFSFGLGIVLLPSSMINTLLVLSALFGGSMFVIYPVSIAHANDFIPPEDVVPASGGLILAYSVGAIAGPIFASWFMELMGPKGLFIYLSLIGALLGVICVWRIKNGPEKPASTPFQSQSHHTMGLAQRSEDSYFPEYLI